MIASLTWLFGAVGLVLAAIGLYGVTAYGVEQRRSEIGVRMALGADRGSVVAMVLRGAFWQVGIGLGIGIPAAIASGISHGQPAFRSQAVESVTVGRCDCASWIGGAGRCSDPRAEGSQHRPDAGTAQRMSEISHENDA